MVHRRYPEASRAKKAHGLAVGGMIYGDRADTAFVDAGREEGDDPELGSADAENASAALPDFLTADDHAGVAPNGAAAS